MFDNIIQLNEAAIKGELKRIGNFSLFNRHGKVQEPRCSGRCCEELDSPKEHY